MNQYDQNIALTSGKMEIEKEYWLKKLSGELIHTSFATDPKGRKTNRIGRFTYRFPDEIYTRLQKISNQSEMALYMVLLTGVKFMLYKYTRNRDIILGMPIFKQKEGAKYLNNLLAVRTQIRSELTFRELLLQLKANIQEAFQHPNYPLAKVAELLGMTDDTKNPFFTTAVLLNTIQSRELIEEGLETIFEFSLPENGLACELIYDQDLFTQAEAELLLLHLTRILDVFTANPQVRLAEVDMLTAREKEQLAKFNQSQLDFPQEKTYAELFAETVQRNPEQIALRFQDQALTYRQLDQRSNRLARYLQKQGIGQEDLVGILLDRSIVMVESILALWKLGAAYVPIDPEYPIQRVNLILLDSGMKGLLTRTEYYIPEFTAGFAGQVLLVDQKAEELATESSESVELEISSGTLAYVIYTSGSTGKPKGAMVEQVGMINHMYAKLEDLQMTQASIVAQNSSHCFDISVWQFFSAFLVGGQTIIYPNDLTTEPDRFIDQVIEDQVTILEVVPSFLSVMLDFLEMRPRKFTELKYLLVTGETVKPDLVRRFFQQYTGITMVNAYGPTEASDDITHYMMEEDPKVESISIGSPLYNLNIYIVDEDLQLVPIGVQGEICVAGIGVGRGYRNDLEKTRLAFMDNPFVQHPERLYKTGDLGAWTPDGDIKFYGRKDYQVKIRGFRIELGEIESKLVDHPEIKEAVVLDREDPQGNKYLCAYLVFERELDLAELKGWLLESLPEYMVPAYFVKMKEMPLSPNGKINKKALPEPDEQSLLGTHYAEARTETEAKLVEIWQHLLGQSQVGIYDNFFEIGGHSLNVTFLLARIKKEFQVDIRIVDFYEYPTLKDLAQFIENASHLTYQPIEVVEERRYYPLSSAQKRLFILDQMLESGISYNVPAIMRVEGKIDRQRFEATFEQLIERHATLRTAFELKEGEPVQRIYDQVNLPISYMEGTEVEIPAMVQEFIQPFDLKTPPLLRIALVKLEEETHLLMLDLHHIVTDGRSMEILLHDFQQIYAGNELTPLKIQYKDFAIWHHQYLQSESYQADEQYWLNEYADGIPQMELPVDFPRSSKEDFTGDTYRVTAEKELLTRLDKMAEKTDSSLFTILLATYNLFLAKYTGAEEIVVGTPVVDRVHVDVENVIGMFANTLAIRNQIRGEETLLEMLDRVKEKVIHALEHQDFQLETLIETLKVGQQEQPLIPTILTYEDQRRQTQLQLPGLKLIPYDVLTHKAKFDLSLMTFATEEGLECHFEYRTSLFKRETIESIAEHFVALLNKVTTDLDQPIQEIEIFSANNVVTIHDKVNEAEAEFDF